MENDNTATLDSHSSSNNKLSSMDASAHGMGSGSGENSAVDRDEELAKATTAGSDDVLMDDDNNPQEQTEEQTEKLPTPLQIYWGWFMVDVLFYIIVLNCAAEWVKSIKIQFFSISMFVAVVLKLLLDAIQWIEHKLHHAFFVKWNRKFLGAFFMWLVVFSSKFLFLWLDDVMFTSYVELGGFVSILILSMVLMVFEKLTRFVYSRIGKCG